MTCWQHVLSAFSWPHLGIEKCRGNIDVAGFESNCVDLFTKNGFCKGVFYCWIPTIDIRIALCLEVSFHSVIKFLATSFAVGCAAVGHMQPPDSYDGACGIQRVVKQDG